MRTQVPLPHRPRRLNNSPVKAIGIIGGMSWVSTAKYYQWLNEGIQKRLGGKHSARLFISSVQWQFIQDCQEQGEWEKAGEYLASEARKLEQLGAEMILLATNTMHKVAPKIEAAITVPFLHLADATADRIKEDALTSVGLIGTKYTMEQDFYKTRLENKGVKVLVPEPEDRELINLVIFEELCRDIINPESKKEYMRIVEDIFNKGAQGIILGCTEITMLIGESDFDKPVFDTTRIHVDRAINMALEK